LRHADGQDVAAFIGDDLDLVLASKGPADPVEPRLGHRLPPFASCGVLWFPPNRNRDDEMRRAGGKLPVTTLGA
jgi:hypothetical protein